MGSRRKSSMRKGTGGGAVKRRQSIKSKAQRYAERIWIPDALNSSVVLVKVEKAFRAGYRAAQRDARKAKESK